jgi:hypothetical protein
MMLEPEAHGRVSIDDSPIGDLTTLPPLILLRFHSSSFCLIECRTSLPESPTMIVAHHSYPWTRTRERCNNREKFDPAFALHLACLHSSNTKCPLIGIEILLEKDYYSDTTSESESESANVGILTRPSTTCISTGAPLNPHGNDSGRKQEPRCKSSRGTCQGR